MKCMKRNGQNISKMNIYRVYIQNKRMNWSKIEMEGNGNEEGNTDKANKKIDRQ